MAGLFETLRRSKSFAIVKEVAKIACKNLVPGGGIISDAIDSYDQIQEDDQRAKLEEILHSVYDQGQEIFKIAEQMQVKSAEQFQILSELPIVQKALEKVAQSLGSIAGIQDFLRQGFEELKNGQFRILSGQDRILEEIQDLKKRTNIHISTGEMFNMEGHLQQAHLAFKGQNFQQAKEKYDFILEKDPYNQESLWGLIRCSIRSASLLEALELSRRLKRDEKSEFQTLSNLLMACGGGAWLHSESLGYSVSIEGLKRGKEERSLFREDEGTLDIGDVGSICFKIPKFFQPQAPMHYSLGNNPDHHILTLTCPYGNVQFVFQSHIETRGGWFKKQIEKTLLVRGMCADDSTVGLIINLYICGRILFQYARQIFVPPKVLGVEEVVASEEFWKHAQACLS